MIKFQDELLSRINMYNAVQEFPQTILLCAESGGGKHTIAAYIAEKFGCPLIELNPNDANELYIDQPERATFYLLNLTEMSVKEQNSILKFLEEPPANVYIICICESKVGVLETILNRCVEFEIEYYWKEDLLSFTNNDWVAGVCRTPGQVIRMNSINFSEMADYVWEFFDKISVANFANALKVTDRIAFKPGEEGFPFESFRLIMQYVAYGRYWDRQDDEEKLKVTTDFIKESISPGVDKRMLFDNYLCKMKRFSK